MRQTNKASSNKSPDHVHLANPHQPLEAFGSLGSNWAGLGCAKRENHCPQDESARCFCLSHWASFRICTDHQVVSLGCRVLPRRTGDLRVAMPPPRLRRGFGFGPWRLVGTMPRCGWQAARCCVVFFDSDLFCWGLQNQNSFVFCNHAKGCKIYLRSLGAAFPIGKFQLDVQPFTNCLGRGMLSIGQHFGKPIQEFARE